MSGNFCPNCGAKKVANVNVPSAWDCTACGKKGVEGNFCPDCGAKRPSVITSWNCTCGKTGISSKFCPECGSKMPS